MAYTVSNAVGVSYGPMRRVLPTIVVFSVVASVLGACHVSAPDSGFSCTDPSIQQRGFERLLVGNGLPFSDQEKQSPYITTAEEANAVLANAQEPNLGVMMDPDRSHVADRVKAFIDGTDFTKEKLTFVVVDRDNDEGFVGVIPKPGSVGLVYSMSCSATGGAPPPRVSVTALYRIPKNATAEQVTCGGCAPPPPCCPP